MMSYRQHPELHWVECCGCKVGPLLTSAEADLVRDVVDVKCLLDKGDVKWEHSTLCSWKCAMPFVPSAIVMVGLRRCTARELADQLCACAAKRRRLAAGGSSVQAEAESPAAAGAAFVHAAASLGLACIVRLLLQLLHAPDVPHGSYLNYASDWTPLHFAALGGHGAAARLLLQQAHGSTLRLANIRTRQGLTPLDVALQGNTAGHREVAGCLIALLPTDVALEYLGHAGQKTRPLYADVAIAGMPLTAQQWECVPSPCPSLGRALPAAEQHSPRQSQQVLACLTPEDRQRLRVFALCLVRAQSDLGTPLPGLAVRQILLHFDA